MTNGNPGNPREQPPSRQADAPRAAAGEPVAATPGPAAVPAEPHMPLPTVWPAILASGVTLILWGLITSVVLSGAGGALFIIAVIGWAQQIRAEARARSHVVPAETDG